MIPEIGHFALILALCLALVQGTFPIIGAHKGIIGWMELARRAALGQFVFMAIAFIALTHAFIVNDFSLVYVANNSNTALPLQYRISAVWGAHEGSLLLWGFILSIWTIAVAIFSRSLPLDTVARVISVMGLISIGFILFMLLTSNPFDRIPLERIPVDGRDLNPLLQDIGLVMHPPMLYMGYVGFSVAFAFAVAALLGGKLDATWARWSRPWTAIAWVFLTIGIALGSWWAYYELGWGGWWFWDPVENASFMPWIVGTALMHSLAVAEKRNAFKSWTVLLAIFAFSLSLLGTFLVRSGVLTSVHAFATDPARGVFILLFLGVVIGGSLSLYAWRAPTIKSVGEFKLLSRETLLLCNNVLLIVVTATILLGTLYPLLLDALGLGKISVGPPYFNSVFVPITTLLAILMGIGPLARWKSNDPDKFKKQFYIPALISIILGSAFVALVYGDFPLLAVLGVTLAIWIVATIILDLKNKLTHRQNKLVALTSLPRSYYSMTVAHIGIAVFIVGITLTSHYSVERDVRMSQGKSLSLAGYDFKFVGVDKQRGPNYESHIGVVQVSKQGEHIVTMHPEKRYYIVQQNPMTEAAIDAGLFRDIYVSLGEPLPGGEAWAVRLYYKPFIRWIWLGAIIMSIGGLLAATDKRYRVLLKRTARNSADNTAAAKA
ncbi:MAG: heme lyase CcmF/NrfE family subunit [Gammaproteobacteria bacterium]|nr:heme lyase CcmF/NrfE family subunit [Gammaproteobacteria bacterium]MDH5777318.1 heme lyase CcmF/NrfE family subunit [Gammaproteobacteria bacterium]